MPTQGDGAPWMMSSGYYTDVKLLRSESVVDSNLRFDASRELAAASAVG
jgi:monooxygenase